MSSALTALALQIGVPLIGRVLTRRIGADNAQLATDVIGAVASRLGVSVAEAEVMAESDPPRVIDAIRAVETMAPELIALHARALEGQYALLMAEQKGPWWGWAWRPAMMWLLAFLWLWTVVILHICNAVWTPEDEAEWRAKIVAFYGDGADEELFCVPSASSGAWLPGPLIEARMTVERPVLRLELPADYMHRPKADQDALLAPFMEELEEALGGLDLAPHYAFGFDFARVADLSVASLLAIEARLKRRETLVVEMRIVPGAEQKLIVGLILARVRERLVGAAFDATGMGWTVAEDMGRIFGLRDGEDSAGLVWAIKFTEDWYRLQMPPLKAAFEDDQLAIHRDEFLLTDLRAVKLVRGIPRVPALREGTKGKTRHGDYAIALALAHFASRMRWVEVGYRAVEDPRRGGGEGQMHPFADDEQETARGWWKPPLGAGLRGAI